MNENKHETGLSQEEAILKGFESINLAIHEIKDDFGKRIDGLKSSSTKIENLLQNLSQRIEIIEEWTVKKNEAPEVRTPLTKIHENNLAKELKFLKAELFKLNDENEHLKIYKHKSFKPEIKPKFRVKDFEIMKSDNGEFSNDELSNDIHREGQNKNVREFCLDSLPSHSFHVPKEFPNGFALSKDIDSDDMSVRTSKGNGNINSAKYPPLSSKFSNDLKINFFNGPNGKNEKKIDKTSSKQPKLLLNKKNSVNSNDSLFRKDDHDSQQLEISVTSDQKKMSIKNVKNFCDFQLLLRDLKNSLNASIYATFNDDIEENVQQLNLLLERYKETDEKIEKLYRVSREKKTKNHKIIEIKYGNASSDVPLQNKVEVCSPDSSYLQDNILKLNELRKTSNFCLYEQKLIQIQSNPSEFESFLYSIKAELSKREQALTEIEKEMVF